MGKRVLLVLLLAAVSLAAAAQQAYVAIEKRLSADQLHETGLDQLTPEQLARLNALLRDDAAQAQTQTIAETRALIAKQPPVERTGEQRGAMSYLGMDVERITTRLKGSISGWEPGTEFHLENGQVWKVLKGQMKLRKPMDAPEIVLVPGIAGRWFLQVDEDLPKARVYRID
jgi:hypothetical protein